MLFSAGERAWGVRCGCRRGLIALEKHYGTSVDSASAHPGQNRDGEARVNGNYLAYRHTLVLLQPGRVGPGEREGYGEPCDVTSLSLSLPRKSILTGVVPKEGGACESL